MDPAPPPPPSPSNNLGIAGFVVSLVGVCTCVLAPVGLILSLLGLRKQPRGLAIAGTIIGGLGTLVLVGLVGFVVVSPNAVGGFKTFVSLFGATAAIEGARGEDGEAPSVEEGQRLIDEYKDGWGNAFRYELVDGLYDIRCAGPDGEFDTKDDFTKNGRQGTE